MGLSSTKYSHCNRGTHTQGLLGMSGCGPPGGAPLGEKRSGLLMREQFPLSLTPGWIKRQFIPQVQFPEEGTTIFIIYYCNFAWGLQNFF